ncbi:MAG: hypothetical protein ACYCW6_28545 [Candidatus Xenobia bacterium]
MRRSLCLLAALLTCSLASAAAPVVAPEVQWISVSQSGRHIGFERGEFVRGQKPGRYAFIGTLVLYLARGLKVGEHFEWSFDNQLRPLTFVEEMRASQAGLPLINTVEGTFDYQTKVVHVHSNEYNQDQQSDVSIPNGRVVSQFADGILLAHTSLAVGKTLTLTEFSTKTKHFMTKKIQVVGLDHHQYKLVMLTTDSPGQVTVWFSPASPAHPNGFMARSLLDSSTGPPIQQDASTREQALEGFEDVAAKMGI